MKVICVNIETNDHRRYNLVLGKCYDVVMDFEKVHPAYNDLFKYYIVSDNIKSASVVVPKSLFVTLEEYRNEKLNKLGI